VGLFCGAIAGGSRILVAFTTAPTLILGGLGLIVVAIGWVYSSAAASFRQARTYYRRHLRTFGLIGATLIPLGYVVAVLQTLAFRVPPIEPFLNIMERFPGIRVLIILTIGSMQAVVAVIFVAPAVIWSMSQIRDGRTPGVIEAYRHGLRAIVPILDARIRVTYRAVLNAITIVRLPRAIRQVIGAAFVGQAVIHDRDGPTAAINDSAFAANVSLKRTILTEIVLAVIVVLTGPLLAILLLIAIPSRPLGLINFVSSFIFAFLYPLSVIGMTLLYFDLQSIAHGRTEVPASEAAEPPTP
jgi:hypothetical protein